MEYLNVKKCVDGFKREYPNHKCGAKIVGEIVELINRAYEQGREDALREQNRQGNCRC